MITRFSCTRTTCRLHCTILKMSKKLGIFDFDHTVVDDNTDVVVRKLLRDDQIPDTTKGLHRHSGWTAYMQEIFKLLHRQHITEESIRNAVVQIPAVNYMPELIKTMVEQLNFDIIIISDSNSLFINDWLRVHKLSDYIHSIFTNPAHYNTDGLLQIRMYHVQNDCKLSTINLCKGMIMEDFIRNQSSLGVHYNRLVYVGDGRNDFCPILRLNKNDLACVRQGYACEDLMKEKGNSENVKASVCLWKTGRDILQYLMQQ